jgi:hypothetical protein
MNLLGQNVIQQMALYNSGCSEIATDVEFSATLINPNDFFAWYYNGELLYYGTGSGFEVFNFNLSSRRIDDNSTIELKYTNGLTSVTQTYTENIMAVPKGLYIGTDKNSVTELSTLLYTVLPPSNHYMYLPNGSYDKLFVQGKFVIDVQDYVFNGDALQPWSTSAGHFVMGEGAEIFVNIGCKVNFGHAYFSSGCNSLWRGVILEGENFSGGYSTLEMAGCLVEDAYCAILANKGVDMLVSRNVFRKNHIAIGYPEVGGQPLKATIHYNFFRGDGLDLFPLPNNISVEPGWPNITNRSYCGQFLLMPNIFDTGVQNTYENISCGVVSRGAGHVSVRESYFTNIGLDENLDFMGGPGNYTQAFLVTNHPITPAVPNLEIEGYGVYADAQANLDCHIEVHHSVFNKVWCGIRTSQLRHTEIVFNTMGDVESVTHGIVVDEPASMPLSEIVVEDNHIHCNTRALLINAPETMGAIGEGTKVADNIFIRGNEVASITLPFSRTVEYYSANETVGNLNVFDNNFVTHHGRGNAVEFQLFDRLRVLDNLIVTGAAPVSNRNLVMNLCRESFIADNKINNSIFLPNTFITTSSIYIIGATNSTIMCNDTDNSIQGLRITGVNSNNCFPTNQIIGNRFRHHADDVVIECVIGEQYFTGNQWCPNLALDGSELYLNNPGTAPGSKFHINNLAGTPDPGCSFLPQTYTINGVELDNTQPNFAGCPFNLMPDPPAESEFVLNTPSGLLSFLTTALNMSNGAAKWDYLTNVFQILSENPTLVAYEQAFSAFLSEYSGTFIEELATIKALQNGRKNLVGDFSGLVDRAELRSEQVDLYKSLSQTDTLNITPSVLPFYQSLTKQIDSITYLLVNDYNEVEEARFEISSELLQHIGSLDDTTGYLLVNKLVSDAEAFYYGQRTHHLLLHQLDYLEIIAQLCSNYYGSAVHRARKLVTRYNLNLFFEDDDCNQSNALIENELTVRAAKPVVSVFPNPTNLDLTVKVHGIGRIQSLVVTNAFGQVVLQQQGFGNESVVIPTQKLTDGVYFCRVAGDNGQTLQASFIVKH